MREGRSAGAGADVDLLALASAVYRRWPTLVLGIMLGALLAFGLAWAFPAPYRAEAVLLVDFNPELARPFSDMRQRFVFLDFQRRPLEALAFSDAVLDAVSDSLAESGTFADATSREDLRRHLSLPHPWEGEWHFLAEYQDPAVAARVANLWAQAFIERAEHARRRAQTRESQLIHLQELSRRLAREQGRCTSSEAAVDLLDELAAELQELPEEGEGEMLASWRLMDIAAWAGVWELGSLPVSRSVRVSEQIVYLTALRDLLSERVRRCPLLLEEIGGQVEAAAAETGVTSSGMGLSPYLEIVEVREAVPPQARAVAEGAWAVVGGLVGLLLSSIGLVLAQRTGVENDIPEG